MEKTQERFAQWAILELLGHRRLAGYVTEATLAGGAFLRIDVPGGGYGVSGSTQFYPTGAVYCLTPTSEETARDFARENQPAPIRRWELPEAQPDWTKIARPGCAEPPVDEDEDGEVFP